MIRSARGPSPADSFSARRVSNLPLQGILLLCRPFAPPARGLPILGGRGPRFFERIAAGRGSWFPSEKPGRAARTGQSDLPYGEIDRPCACRTCRTSLPVEQASTEGPSEATSLID